MNKKIPQFLAPSLLLGMGMESLFLILFLLFVGDRDHAIEIKWKVHTIMEYGVIKLKHM